MFPDAPLAGKVNSGVENSSSLTGTKTPFESWGSSPETRDSVSEFTPRGLETQSQSEEEPPLPLLAATSCGNPTSSRSPPGPGETRVISLPTLTALLLRAPGLLFRQSVRHQLEGAFRVGHSLLHSQELLLRGVDGGVLAQDVAVITGLPSLCGLRENMHKLLWAERSPTRWGGDRGSVGSSEVQHTQQEDMRGWSQAEE